MTPAERQQSLANARQARDWLKWDAAPYLPESSGLSEKLECLIAEFDRLDAGEQKRNEAGRKFGKLGAKHGKKGGWPKGKPRKGKK